MKIIGWILYIALKMVIGAIRIVLTFITAYICLGGSVFYTTYDITGFVFVITSLLYPPSGIITVRGFWPIFFFGIALGTIPTLITNVGTEEIYAARGLLSKI